MRGAVGPEEESTPQSVSVKRGKNTTTSLLVWKHKTLADELQVSLTTIEYIFNGFSCIAVDAHFQSRTRNHMEVLSCSHDTPRAMAAEIHEGTVREEKK
ncbi:hypothetical protein F2P81_015213 [Scophthalmus maximus]|uniref:Uncharacterized protein n=1 Tax=Scophthalmus maximus TaxID=52904 RepID=A0A6A4SFJ3_SCOMX|nr:hypothetical protein F2P81_015213 [Scophthalmus maximus]